MKIYAVGAFFSSCCCCAQNESFKYVSPKRRILMQLNHVNQQNISECCGDCANACAYMRIFVLI